MNNFIEKDKISFRNEDIGVNNMEQFKMPFMTSNGKIIYRNCVKTGFRFYEECYYECVRNKVIPLDFDICALMDIFDDDQFMSTDFPFQDIIELSDIFDEIGLNVDYYGYNNDTILVMCSHEDDCYTYHINSNKLRNWFADFDHKKYAVELYTNTLIEN